MSDGKLRVLQTGGHLADPVVSSLFEGNQAVLRNARGLVSQPLTVPPHDGSPPETPASRHVAVPRGYGNDSAVKRASHLEDSLKARGLPMAFNPKVVDDLSRENSRLKMELMRIGQGGRMLSIDQTLHLTQLQEENTSLRVELEEAHETIQRQSLTISDLKEQLDERELPLPVHASRLMVDKGTETCASLLVAESDVTRPSKIYLDSSPEDKDSSRKAMENIRHDDRVASLLSPTQPDLVIDSSPPSSLLAFEQVELKKENASLRAEKEILQQSATVASQKLEETKNEVVQLKKEMASLQAKTEGLTKELEKKRDENRQWRDHADILESGRMKAQQEADTWREKLKEWCKDRERERVMATQLRQDVEKGTSEIQRLQKQLGYTVSERNELQQQLNLMRAQLADKGRQEVKQEDIIQELREQLQELRRAQRQLRVNTHQQNVPGLPRGPQQDQYEQYRFGDYRAPFPQLISHSPTAPAPSHGMPQTDDIHSRGVRVAKPQYAPAVKEESESRPVWRRKEEEATEGGGERKLALGDDSGNETGDSARMAAGLELASDQYGPLQAWLKKHNMKPAFGGTYTAQLSSVPTATTSTVSTSKGPSVVPNFQSTAAPTFQSTFPTSQSSVPVCQSLAPASTSAVPAFQSAVPAFQSAVPAFRSAVPICQSAVHTSWPSVPTVQSPCGQTPITPGLQQVLPASLTPKLQSTTPQSHQMATPTNTLLSVPSVRSVSSQGMQTPVPNLLSLLPPENRAYVPASVNSRVPPGMKSVMPVGRDVPSVAVTPSLLDGGFRPSSRAERQRPMYLQCPQCNRKFDSGDFTSYREHLERCLI